MNYQTQLTLVMVRVAVSTQWLKLFSYPFFQASPSDLRRLASPASTLDPGLR
jgi:hypothetical protein